MSCLLLVILPMIVACSGPAGSRTIPEAGRPDAARTSQQPIVIAFAYEPALLEPTMVGGSGNRDVASLFSAFLTTFTPDNEPRPYLAEELPSVANGTWRVLPDGGMETTYRLKRTATWHDGKPVTAHDFVFGHKMHLDPDLPTTRIDVDRRMESVQAVDDSTLLIRWKEPYLWAGTVFGPNFPAAPRHLLEELSQNNREAFINGPHWGREFVGNGAFKVERWEQGVEMALRAHDGFALGKPKTDHIILRFVSDANTVVANLLSGTIDSAFHATISFSHNKALEQAGWKGTTQYWRGSPHYIEFQARDWGETPRALSDARVRRALIHGVDRQSLIDGLYMGVAQEHHFWLNPADPAFAAVDRAVSKYPYDPTRAAALFREAGWVRGNDGVLRDSTGAALTIPLLSQPEDIDLQQSTILADNWKSIGVNVEMSVLTRGQQRDREYRSKWPGAAYNNRPVSYETMIWRSGQVTQPDQRWVGDNYYGYVNPVLERAWLRMLGTIEPTDREPLLIEALAAMTSDAYVNPTHLQPRAMVFRDGIAGPQQPWAEEYALIWNAWDWHWQ